MYDCHPYRKLAEVQTSLYIDQLPNLLNRGHIGSIAIRNA